MQAGIKLPSRGQRGRPSLRAIPSSDRLQLSSMGRYAACPCRPAPGGQTPILDTGSSVFKDNILLVAKVGEAFSEGLTHAGSANMYADILLGGPGWSQILVFE